MKISKSSNHSWLVDGQIINCRSSVKALVMQNYYRVNKINPRSVLELPIEQFKKHHSNIKDLYRQFGLE